MQIAKFITIFGAVLCGKIYAEETRTFPGAEIIIPAIIGQVIPIIIGGITGGGGGSILPPVPPISASHSTALATSVANRPVVVSHSGSISTQAHTSAGSQATGGSQGSLVAASVSNTGPKQIQALSNRWRKFFNNLG